MTQILKQSTAVDVLIGPFVDSADGYTAESGLSPAVKLSKNGQALAAKNDVTTPVHDADGYYNCELDATDTNTVGTLVLTVVGSATSLPVRHEFQVVEEATYDFLYASGATPIADINAECDTAISDASLATAAALATVDSNVDAILVDTAEIGAAGAGLTAVPWNAAWDAEVQSEVTDALNAYDPPTKAELDGGFAALNDPTAAAIADAVWDEAKAGHVGAGSFGEEVQAHALSSEVSALNDVSAADVNAQCDTAISDAALATAAALATVDTVVDAIKAKTDDLTFTVANQLDANIQYVNDVQVTGTGASGDEWGP